MASPFIVSWPAGIKDCGALRHTEGHLIDIVPTLVALVGGIPDGVRPADAPPLPGKNLLPAFAADVEIPRDYLYFSHIGNEAIRMDGWKAVKLKGGDWELYRTADDRTETHNLAAQYPERLQELVQRWEMLDAQFKAQSEESPVSVPAAKSQPVAGIIVLDGSRYEKLTDVPELTMQNKIVWRMEVNPDPGCDPGGILMGNRNTPGTDAFFKITPSKGVQLYQNKKHLFRIDAKIPFGRWTTVEVIKDGPQFTVNIDGKEVGRASIAETVPAMPCYLGGDPKAGNFARCLIRNASVDMK
jgi:hypothetical protein